jgi:hypothetical protein
MHTSGFSFTLSYHMYSFHLLIMYASQHANIPFVISFQSHLLYSEGNCHVSFLQFLYNDASSVFKFIQLVRKLRTNVTIVEPHHVTLLRSFSSKENTVVNGLQVSDRPVPRTLFFTSVPFPIYQSIFHTQPIFTSQSFKYSIPKYDFFLWDVQFPSQLALP